MPFSPAVHVLIPFAFCSSEACRPALPTLPHLTRLLGRLTPRLPTGGDDMSFSTPHELALAQALGLPQVDGLIPWAALHAQDVTQACAFITPCHWQTTTHHISMAAPGTVDISETESRQLLTTMQPYFETDGIALKYLEPDRWLARGDVFRTLSTASLDRVTGRSVETWMPRGEPAATLRRLQSEMQMLLYTHAVNDPREARHALPINSFWISGSGALPPGLVTSLTPQTNECLRTTALTEDWPAWAAQWQALDAGLIANLLARAQQGEALQLTLCGERQAQTWDSRPRSLYRKVCNVFRPQPTSNMLEKL